MATCIYFRTAGSSGICAIFLIDNTKVAPLNQESIPKLETYCANRIGEMLTLCKAEQWKQFPGKDSATRGILLRDVKKNWSNAPEFLPNKDPTWWVRQER